MKSKVYFTREISSEKLLEIYKKLGVELKGKVAVKVHSGEKGNQNYLKPLFYKDFKLKNKTKYHTLYITLTILICFIAITLLKL